MLNEPIIISIFDYSGSWSAPYRWNGYKVIQIDKKLGIDVFSFQPEQVRGNVYGILAAPPCTDFANSGNQYFDQKDKDGRTAESLELVYRTLEIIEYFKPSLAFWGFENPVGRLPRLVPELGNPWYFQPCDFGDPWTKRTGIWGNFNKPKVDAVAPLKYTSAGKTSFIMALGGEKRKNQRIKEHYTP